jgi:predicted nucleotidyltransferase
MTSSLVDLSGRADLEWLAELIGDLRQSSPGVQWLIVGALARDIHLAYAHSIRMRRATTDTDVALTIAEWTEFTSVRNALIERGAFRPHQRIQHKLVHRNGRAIDIVPFGGIEDTVGVIAWPPDGAERMNVAGYKEALAGSVELKLPLRQTVQVVSIAGLIVLKIFAWAERHVSQPGKDAYDLSVLLEHYLEAGNEDRLYADHADLLEVEDFDFSRAGARIAGRDTMAFLSSTSADPASLRARLVAIVEPELDPARSTALIEQAGTKHPEEFRKHLLSFFSGFNE